jgi:O-antigen/teichoic acid export membrane protein
MLAGFIVTRALRKSAGSRLAKHYAAGNGRAFGALLLKLVGIGLLLGGAGMLVVFVAGREILTLLYQPEYARPEVFIRLMIVAGMRYVGSFLGYGMTAARYFRAKCHCLLSLLARQRWPVFGWSRQPGYAGRPQP